MSESNDSEKHRKLSIVLGANLPGVSLEPEQVNNILDQVKSGGKVILNWHGSGNEIPHGLYLSTMLLLDSNIPTSIDIHTPNTQKSEVFWRLTIAPPQMQEVTNK